MLCSKRKSSRWILSDTRVVLINQCIPSMHTCNVPVYIKEIPSNLWMFFSPLKQTQWTWQQHSLPPFASTQFTMNHLNGEESNLLIHCVYIHLTALTTMHHPSLTLADVWFLPPIPPQTLNCSPSLGSSSFFYFCVFCASFVSFVNYYSLNLLACWSLEWFPLLQPLYCQHQVLQKHWGKHRTK